MACVGNLQIPQSFISNTQLPFLSTTLTLPNAFDTRLNCWICPSVRLGHGNSRSITKSVSSPKEDVLEDALNSFSEQNLAEASKKYDLESDLFAEVHFAQINAFTDRQFSGNPAAVCYLPYEKDNDWLQLVAKELNVSETAFVTQLDKSDRKDIKYATERGGSEVNVDANNEFTLRWFTPTVEVDLCGHATLAAAHLLFATGIVDSDVILFHTRSGILQARKIAGYSSEYKDKQSTESAIGDNDDIGHLTSKEKKTPSGNGLVELDFPLVVATECDSLETEAVSAALGVPEIVWCGKTSLGDYLVELPQCKNVQQLRPHLDKMLDFPGRGGLIATALAPDGTIFDFVSRFFCPKSGIPEDPVTGSAHCSLGPYWAKKLNKNRLEAFQASERGGKLTVCVDEKKERVYLQGSAMMFKAGVLLNTVS